MLAGLALLLVTGCTRRSLDEIDEIYTTRSDRRVFCGASIDSQVAADYENDLASITRGLERARRRGEVIELFTHRPGVTVTWARLELVLAKAAELGLVFVTYPELGAPLPPGGGLALGFDDDAVAEWYAARPLLDRYGAKVTFFVTRYDLFSPEARAMLHELAADGHAIEAHGLRHQRGPAYVTEHGLAAYLREEVLPSLELLRADGFAPTTFAYPFGARTGETDAALLEHVDRVRSVSFSVGGFVSDPCPE